MRCASTNRAKQYRHGATGWVDCVLGLLMHGIAAAGWVWLMPRAFGVGELFRVHLRIQIDARAGRPCHEIAVSSFVTIFEIFELFALRLRFFATSREISWQPSVLCASLR